MGDKTNYHMSTSDFRRHGHALIDWIANYLDTVEDKPVSSQVKPGAIRSMIPDHAPEEPEEFASIMADLDRVVMPGITHWQSPNWFAYFPANSSPPAILGELAAAGLAVQGMLWSTSPAATEVESAVLDWLVDLLGLPQSWKMTGPGGGVIQMSHLIRPMQCWSLRGTAAMHQLTGRWFTPRIRPIPLSKRVRASRASRNCG